MDRNAWCLDLDTRILAVVREFLDVREQQELDLAVSLDAERAHCHDALAAAVSSSSLPVESPLGRLRLQIGLDSDDTLILLLAAAPYLDERLKERLRALQRSVLADRCTVGLALRLLERPGTSRFLWLERFDPDRPLFRHGLIRIESPSDTRADAILERVLAVPRRTVDLLLGVPRLDERASPYCTLEHSGIRLDRVVLPPRRKEEVLSLVRHHASYRTALRQLGFDDAIPQGRGIVLLFSGPPGTGKTLFARALACELARPLLRARSDKLAEAAEAIEDAIEAMFHEALLHDGIVLIDECEALFSKRGAKLAYLLQAIDAFEGILILATNMPEALDRATDRRIVLRMDFDLPEPVDREQIWEMHLPPGADVDSEVDVSLLANLFNISGGAIKNAVVTALSRAVDRAPEAPRIDMALLRHAAESQLRSNLEDLAHRSRIALRLDDLVLPEVERRKIDEILAACKHKDLVQNRWGLGKRLATGRGIAILFDGPPGTGKTLCAEILAAELDKPVFRVHIPNIVSKWVGETEKNISDVFTRARAAQAILLFDEADSLFSKRTEVRSSNDRFANQEVNLLLQEIERSEGIVMLTTNLFGGLDDALKRRIQYRVTFPMPEARERARIWETLTPVETPVAADVDFARLGAQFEFAGGAIKNAIVRASYRAYSDGGALTMSHLIEAGRIECEALGIAVRQTTYRIAPPALPARDA